MCALALSHFSWNEALDFFLADAAQGGDWLPATPVRFDYCRYVIVPEQQLFDTKLSREQINRFPAPDGRRHVNPCSCCKERLQGCSPH